MPRKVTTRETLPKLQCDGPGEDARGNPLPAERCKNMVAQTRKSRTGRHYCQRSACQSARVRAYQVADAEITKRQVRIWELVFVHDAANKTRIECPSCGLENALPGWPHRSADGGNCRELTLPTEKRSIGVDMIDAVWPHPVYAGGRL